MKTIKIKAGGITNLTDARYFAAREVEWLGFNLVSGSAHYMEPNQMKAIKEWVDGVKILGELDMLDALAIEKAWQELELDVVQVGHFTVLDALKPLADKSIPIFKEWVIEKAETLEGLAEQLALFQPYVQGFVLDFQKNGINWRALNGAQKESLAHLCENFPCLLSMEVTPNELQEIITLLQPMGIQLTGGSEEKVGLKSFDELDELFEVLEKC
ncbi:MAG TPA: N-(5'-phosphoribosyl)anthranilate isomerase [Saprospiraceae bacterium]|nr:N-(5'-phosphoribosyl)anthranilate isomerase [Saprospiraceae bacterium]HMQ84301.1 N-(5'-phosphoribosyl)anthranilate isomerase [Saprospiraceae bacterium]